MDRNVRYHRLSSVEEDSSSHSAATAAAATTPPPPPVTEAINNTAAVVIDTTGTSVDDAPVSNETVIAMQLVQPAAAAAPPPYAASDDVGAAAAAANSTASNAGAPKYTGNVLPSYMIATELPTYDQVQQLKLEEQQQEPVLDPDTVERGDALLGTDFMFLCAFFVAFLFNWIGFLMLMCFCPTIAGRYGALAGFGLSLAKWTLIVKHSTDLIKTENNWLWWLILAFGVLICVRAVLQYLHVKREWSLLTRATQERLMYFY